jgi:predicted phosphodiesterase
MQLAEIIGGPGVAEIQAAGAIRFQAVGDTGRPDVHNTNQESVATQMSSDFDPNAGAKNPAFFLHLGDVIYGPGKDQLYRDEFYRAYKDYPGKIIAVPGNHDGEVFSKTDPVSLKSFRDNFCAASAVVPPIAGQVRIFRQTMTQPGVYFLANCPFVDVVCLYSNVAEGPGSLVGANGDAQQKVWLAQTLAAIAQQRKAGQRKALIFAVHHPPYSNGGHSGSAQMLADMDAACKQAGIQPDAVISGHAHNYQRHTRRVGTRQIPFIVAGSGGHNDSAVGAATGQIDGDHSFDKSFKGFGYLMVTASAKKLQLDFFEITAGSKRLFDSVSVNLS